jgi:hypothetical protein
MAVSRHFVPYYPFKLLPWPLQLGEHNWGRLPPGEYEETGVSNPVHLIDILVVIVTYQQFIALKARQYSFLQPVKSNNVIGIPNQL